MVREALSSRFAVPTAKEFICETCDIELQKGEMPVAATALHRGGTLQSMQRHVCC